MERMSIEPAVIQNSDYRFYYPPTLIDDFSAYLRTDVPNANYTFEVVRDWYARQVEGYETLYIRGEYFPINWKSKIGNSDANSNQKTDYSIILHKGDIVIREDGRIYIQNWKVQTYPNNQSTQAIDYDIMLRIERKMERVLDDETGFVLSPGGIGVVCPDIPATVSVYAGRPDYANNYNVPGIHPDHLLNGQVQCNATTQTMTIGDEFDYFQHRYRIVDMNLTEVDPATERGLINFNAKRVAGAFIDDE